MPKGKVAAELTVNHRNSCKTDNHKDNLEWMTHSENCRHAVATGLRNKPSLYYETPLAVFGSSRQAATAHGTYKEKIERWCKSGRRVTDGWDYLLKLGTPQTMAPIDVLRAVVEVVVASVPTVTAQAYCAEALCEDEKYRPVYWCRILVAGKPFETEAAETIGEAFRRFEKVINRMLPGPYLAEEVQKAA
ncbi:hypothetical protein GCM10011378_02370 [Hymenobacter glacieicola]|uniref:HNH nuclease domain-containing protein n=1 Tax=Hymenobacter glacieicola TaxID=1562124 RepID=A0ABQ1WG13_9BACT|nr:hypothetical protein GCM10011378_02370 [Hymenobacter glacieicola]